MPLSKHYLDMHAVDVPVNFNGMAEFLRQEYPEISFALVMGSAAKGIIGKNSDLDIAVYYDKQLNWKKLSAIMQSLSDMHQDIRCDLGLLNNAEVVYRYEALKGRLLFFRDQECWLRFYSQTCREYETQMYHYQKQLQYRMKN